MKDTLFYARLKFRLTYHAYHANPEYHVKR